MWRTGDARTTARTKGRVEMNGKQLNVLGRRNIQDRPLGKQIFLVVSTYRRFLSFAFFVVLDLRRRPRIDRCRVGTWWPSRRVPSTALPQVRSALVTDACQDNNRVGAATRGTAANPGRRILLNCPGVISGRGCVARETAGTL
jgi:hypothetical protein